MLATTAAHDGVHADLTLSLGNGTPAVQPPDMRAASPEAPGARKDEVYGDVARLLTDTPTVKVTGRRSNGSNRAPPGGHGPHPAAFSPSAGSGFTPLQRSVLSDLPG
ncbi:hypothetical protein GCM10027075_49150 [Streptomyces heilongjiangensis]